MADERWEVARAMEGSSSAPQANEAQISGFEGLCQDAHGLRKLAGVDEDREEAVGGLGVEDGSVLAPQPGM